MKKSNVSKTIRTEYVIYKKLTGYKWPGDYWDLCSGLEDGKRKMRKHYDENFRLVAHRMSEVRP